MIATHFPHQPLADGTKYSAGHLCAYVPGVKFGTKIKVYCPRTKRTIIVTVHDRFYRHGYIDLDTRSFKELSGRDWVRRGTEKVECRIEEEK